VVLALHTVNQIDEIIKQAQARCRAPSLIAGVVRDGMLAHVSAAGETPVPERDLQYRIGSITKSFTAALILQLRDEQRLSLDDALCEHLPVTGLAGIRLRHLLGQASGLQREPDGAWWERNAGTSLDALVAGVTDAKSAFPPYQRFHYSNLGYGLLGGVVERVTGQPWWDVVSARLLGPLGMTRTSYHPQEPFAPGYVVHPWRSTLREEPRHDAGAMAPAGQLWSTVEDLGRWATILASDESPVLPAMTLAEMLTPVVMTDLDSWTGGYGLGVALWRHGDSVYVGHTGSMPGYLAVMLVHRPTRTGVVAFANSYSLSGNDIGRLGLSIMDAALAGEPAPYPAPWRPSRPPPPDIEALCGRWWWMGMEYELRWDSHTSELVIETPTTDDGPWTFAREDTDRWRGRGGEQAGEVLQVLRDDSGKPTAVDIATMVFTRDPLPDD
jgi:CubicO group peptidase (beta-lactamase class C family)